MARKWHIDDNFQNFLDCLSFFELDGSLQGAFSAFSGKACSSEAKERQETTP